MSAAPAAPIVSRYAQDPVLSPLLRDFLADLPHQLAELGAALQGADGRRAAQLSHRLKGDAAIYDLPELARAAAELEDQLRAGRRPEGGLVAALECVGRRVLDGGHSLLQPS